MFSRKPGCSLGEVTKVPRRSKTTPDAVAFQFVLLWPVTCFYFLHACPVGDGVFTVGSR